MTKKKEDELKAKIAAALKRRHLGGAYSQSLDKTPVQDKTIVRAKAQRRPLKAIKRTEPKGSDIFITGGIGDVLAIESFMTDEERSKLEVIHYATHKSATIKTLFSALPNYPNLKVQSECWTDFSKFWCFMSKDECLKKMAPAKLEISERLRRARDFSIMLKFDHIKRNMISYNGSSFLKHKLADIEKFGLPDYYVTICPYSSDTRIPERNFTIADWEQCLQYLRVVGMKGVILNSGNDPVPDSPLLIDLTNETNILEAIEVLKASEGYVGIDSSLSVLAAKLFSHPRLLVKSVNNHCYQNAMCYYAPQTDFGFMVKSITVPECLPKRQDDRVITLNVCQGVGDIFWVYQKFAPYVDGINFCISQVPSVMAKLQSRAVDFLKLMPKVRDVTFRMITHEQYQMLWVKTYSVEKIIKEFNSGGLKEFDYAINTPLENGIRIDDLDPGYEIEETVQVKMEELPEGHLPDQYMTVYVSGSTDDKHAAEKHSLWSVEEWFDFIMKFRKKYDQHVPVVLIGASYDGLVALRLEEKLREAGVETRVLIDEPSAKVAYILKNSLVYIGYQSGLNILADNLGVKQVMLYFPYLKPMLYTWCKRKHIEDGTFNASTFDNKPDVVLDGLRLYFSSQSTQEP